MPRTARAPIRGLYKQPLDRRRLNHDRERSRTFVSRNARAKFRDNDFEVSLFAIERFASRRSQQK
jgi:hypothetical protein